MSDSNTPINCGDVVSVRGSVVDIRFDDRFPPIYTLLYVDGLAHGDQGRIVIEVLEQRDAHCVRGIALTPTQGLARGRAVPQRNVHRPTKPSKKYLAATSKSS